MLTIETTEDPNSIREGVEVIRNAWGSDDFATFLKDFLTGVSFNGGIVLVAKENGKIVGFSFSIVGFRKKLYIYSHMTGVNREYWHRDIGYLLKLKQREISIERGFDLVAWTFDPLQGLNSNFNLRKLGAIARVYRRNHYGIMTDSLNLGLPSDRVVAEWFIKSKHVEDRINGRLNNYGKMDDAIITEQKNGIRLPVEINLDLNSEYIRIEIPRDINKIKKESFENAKLWREFTAKVYEHYFGKGYALIDFISDGNRNFQIASKILPEGVEKSSIFL